MRLLILFFVYCVNTAFTQTPDTAFLRVHFLYGSKPKHAFKTTEHKWFGGIHGGHVGIESETGEILNFLPSGGFHIIAKPDERHSRFAIHDHNSFYSMFGGDSVKRSIVTIPITPKQKQLFDSIALVYLEQTPYDYAFIGMRCGSAAYEILAQLDIVKSYSENKTGRKIFYPKKLRKRLFRKAKSNGWKIETTAGSYSRKWEKD